MKSRIFIGISIPEKAKLKLIKTIEKWRELPIRWIKESNLHITLIFLGLINKEVIPDICEKIKNIVENTNIFDVKFDQIELFPSIEEPKLIALVGKINGELKDLVNTIEKKLGISNIPKKSFKPHITLGRIRKEKWEVLENKPFIQEKFLLDIPVETIEIISSELGKNGSNYIILESCPLN